ncbi:MAG: 1-aminocyclopropane-1-carboxylate deaminase/D-cysteine desulfhydrase [Pseudonocardiaceae bacterium]
MLTADRPRLRLGHFPTRLTRWSDLGAHLGIDLWVKHEFEADAFGSGNKVRKMEFLLAHVLDHGYTGMVLDGTTQSNCAMSAALYGPHNGLSLHLILYGATTRVGNYVDVLRSGAQITQLPAWSPRNIADAQKRIFDRAGAEGQALYSVPTGATNTITVFASIALAEEIAQQEDEQGARFDFIVYPTGTGGTQAGLEIGRLVLGRNWSLVGVAVANDSEFFHRVTRELVKSPAVSQLIITNNIEQLNPWTHTDAQGPGYGVPLPDTFSEIRRLRFEFGLILDSVYTYKAYIGLRQLINDRVIPAGASVVFIHTGGVNERFIHPVP